MKKEYKRIEVHVKEATVQKEGEAVCIETECYFDKKDVLSIIKHSLPKYNKKLFERILDEYLTKNNINLYCVRFILGECISNVILSEEQLQYLCED